MTKLNLLGIDPAFTNVGLAVAEYDIENARLTFTDLELIETSPESSKTVRKSSDDLRRAQKIVTHASGFVNRADIVFAEIPTGSQSARSSWTLGIALGLIAALTIDQQLIQVDARDVKETFTGSKTASKDTMIETATERYPDLPWLEYRGKLTNKNEHLADAVAIVEHGLTTQQFLGLASVLGSLAA